VRILSEIVFSIILAVSMMLGIFDVASKELPSVIFAESSPQGEPGIVSGSIGCIGQSTWYYLPMVQTAARKAGKQGEFNKLVAAFKSKNERRRSERYLTHEKYGRLIEVIYEEDADNEGRAGEELCHCVTSLMR